MSCGDTKPELQQTFVYMYSIYLVKRRMRIPKRAQGTLEIIKSLKTTPQKAAAATKRHYCLNKISHYDRAKTCFVLFPGVEFWCFLQISLCPVLEMISA